MKKTCAVDDLAALVSAIFVHEGAPREIAVRVAEHLVEAELRGIETHGIMRLAPYLTAISAGRIDPSKYSSLELDCPSYARLNGNNGFGCVVASEAIDLAIEKASTTGLGMVTLHGCYHIGWLADYAERAARSGLVGLVSTNGHGVGSAIAPYGSVQRALPSCAIAFSFPNPASNWPITVDMSLGNGSVGAVWMHEAAGTPLPYGWLIDASGEATVDATQLKKGGALLPLGAPATHKGSALAVAIDLLVGCLTPPGPSVRRDGPSGNAAVFMAFRPDRFRSGSDYGEQMDSFVRHYRGTATASASADLELPGDRRHHLRCERLRNGIPLAPATEQMLAGEAAKRSLASAL